MRGRRPSPVTLEGDMGPSSAVQQDDVSGFTVIAVQQRCFRRLASHVSDLRRSLVAYLRPFLTLSQYGLGVVLILCVTVIWVASSMWIQHLFGALEFSKPYFLTFFNTTGFCCWNVGFFLSPRWRRTPWTETSDPRAVCIEDARLDPWAWPRDYRSLRNNDEVAQLRTGDAQLSGRLPSRPSSFPTERAGTVHSAPLRSPLPSFGLLRPAMQAKSDRYPVLQTTAAAASVPSTFSGASSLSARLLDHGRSAVGRSITVDNDDVDGQVEVGGIDHHLRTDDELRVADECRDYSPSTSSASSMREEVVNVILTDEDESEGVAMAQATLLSSHITRHYDAADPRCRHRHNQRVRHHCVRRYSLHRIWRCTILFCPFWFFANYFFNASLSLTSVASNTVLSSTSSVWTLLLSYVLLRQPVGLYHVLGVILSVSGSILVALSDHSSSSGSNGVGGDILALLSAFFYAAYTSVLKLYLPDDERFAMGMVFGAVGTMNFFFLWPGLVLLNKTGVEPFTLPSWHQFWPLLMNALIGTNFSDVLWARSVVLTSPVVATLGLSLTTPLAMVVDAVFKSRQFSAAYVAGALLVMMGFLLAALPFRMAVGL